MFIQATVQANKLQIGHKSSTFLLIAPRNEKLSPQKMLKQKFSLPAETIMMFIVNKDHKKVRNVLYT